MAGLIAEAFHHFFSTRYRSALQPGGSGSKWRDARKKFEWSFREPEMVRELRDKLRTNTERLTLLNGLATQ
jgi:hypothetical protein